jgi:glycosyltransferase involved in cell wall biosynthesis
LKVTILGPAYPLRGGIAHHLFWLHKELSARGHEVQVISFRSLYPRLLFPGTTELDTSGLKLDVNALSIIRPLNPLTWLAAHRHIRAFAPRVVVVEWWNTFFAPSMGTLLRLARRAGARSIVECHNIMPHERGLPDRLLLGYAFSPVDSFITHSAEDRARLLEAVPGKDVRVAMLPIHGAFARPVASRRDGRRILFFGLVRKYKGLDVLLRAMPRVLARVECRLLVAGEFYDPLEKYQKIIRELGLEPFVEIINRYVPNEEVPEIFNRADVLVLPYTSASQSGVAHIALSNHLPIIASRAGGLPEAVRENVTGLLFPAGDHEALADRLIYYFENNLGPKFARAISSGKANGAGDDIATVIEQIGAYALSRGR